MSEDGRYAVVQVQFDDNAQSVPVTDRALIPERGEAALADAGVTAHYSVEITQDTSLIGPGEVIGLTVALVVLVVVLGSLVAAGLPCSSRCSASAWAWRGRSRSRRSPTSTR